MPSRNFMPRFRTILRSGTLSNRLCSQKTRMNSLAKSWALMRRMQRYHLDCGCVIYLHLDSIWEFSATSQLLFERDGIRTRSIAGEGSAFDEIPQVLWCSVRSSQTVLTLIILILLCVLTLSYFVRGTPESMYAEYKLLCIKKSHKFVAPDKFHRVRKFERVGILQGETLLCIEIMRCSNIIMVFIYLLFIGIYLFIYYASIYLCVHLLYRIYKYFLIMLLYFFTLLLFKSFIYF